MTRLSYRLKSYVELRKAVQTPNSGGGYTRTYGPMIRKFACAIEELSGREILLNKNAGTGASVRVTMRYLSDVKKDLFLHTISTTTPVRIFRIDSVQIMNNGEYLEVMCEEIEEDVDE